MRESDLTAGSRRRLLKFLSGSPLLACPALARGPGICLPVVCANRDFLLCRWERSR